MERLASWLTQLSPVVAIMGWLTYLQKDKVSKATCQAKHEGVCDKLDLILANQSKFEDILIRHIEGKK